MSKTIVHIGFPRTASTWFQKSFFSKIENYTHVERKIVQDKLIHPSSLSFKPEDFLNILPANDNLLISEEMITGRMRGGFSNHLFFKEFASRINACFPEAHYVVFLRSQPHLINSLYKLYVHRGGTYSLKRFLNVENKRQNNMLYSHEFLKYDLYLDYLSKLVSKERIHVFLYEEFLSNPSQLLEKLSKQLNLAIDLSSVNYKRENQSLGKSSLLIKRVLNSFSRYGIPFKHYFFHLPYVYRIKLPVKRTAQKDEQVIPDEIRSIENIYWHTNKKVMEQFGVTSLKEYGYPLPE